ncbi:MAG: hypothetical protein ABFS28_01335 [Bacteroidota bacterium]
MRRRLYYVVLLGTILVTGAACDRLFGPDKKGEFRLSSETFGDSYYLFGYSYEKGEFYKFPFQGEPIPDIINEGFRELVGGEVVSLPGFNTPGQVNGFALVGEFSDLEEARGYYNGYDKVEEDLQFVTVSDIVELYQVWVQKTEAGNYVKLLVKDVKNVEGENGVPYNEVVLEYTYQADGSTGFPD